MELGGGLESYAIEAFVAAVCLRPSWSAAYSQLGQAYASANRREEAVESYKQALRLQPEDLNTLAGLAHASLLLGRYEETERSATLMIEVAPLVSVPYLMLGVTQLLQCWYADADESLRRAISLEPELAEACYGIGLAAIALGNDSVVQFQHERLIELDRRLAAKLFEHRRRGSFTPTEVVRYLFETAADVGRAKNSLGLCTSEQGEPEHKDSYRT
jgi:tetratricopeptide (TPR) repeat protein